jgi:hypothetical protein
LAVANKQLGMINVLMQWGANSQIKDNEGKVPLECGPPKVDSMFRKIRKLVNSKRSPKLLNSVQRRTLLDGPKSS